MKHLIILLVLVIPYSRLEARRWRIFQPQQYNNNFNQQPQTQVQPQPLPQSQAPQLEAPQPSNNSHQAQPPEPVAPPSPRQPVAQQQIQQPTAPPVDRPARPIAPAPKETKNDAKLVAQINDEMANDPLYQTWKERHLTSTTTAEQFERAFSNTELDDLLTIYMTKHSVRPDLQERIRKGLKVDFLLEGVPLVELADLMRTEFYNDQTRLVPLDTPRAKAARQRWLSEPILSKMKLILQVGSEHSIAFNTRLGRKEVKGMDSLFAAALSEPTLSQFASRQLTFKDAEGKTSALPVTLTQTETVKQVSKILSHFWKDPSRAQTLSLTGPSENRRPPDAFYAWSSKKEDLKYFLKDNSDSRDTFDAKLIASQVAEAPEVKVAMLKDYLDWRKGTTGKREQKKVFEQPELAAHIDTALNGREHLRQKTQEQVYKTMIQQTKSLSDHRNPDSVKIQKVPVRLGQPVVAPKDPEIPRIAVVFPGNVRHYQEPAARTLGAETFYVHNATQARNVIKNLYAKHGQKMDVIFASHGNQSYIEGILSLNDPATQDLLNSTEGMIKRAYLMGCYAGGGTERIPDHLIKQFVSHGADSAVGVDRLLWANGRTFYLNEHGGNAIFAVANYKKQHDALSAAEKALLETKQAQR